MKVKKKIKNKISIMLVLLMIVSVMAGCGKGSNDKKSDEVSYLNSKNDIAGNPSVDVNEIDLGYSAALPATSETMSKDSMLNDTMATCEAPYPGTETDCLPEGGTEGEFNTEEYNAIIENRYMSVANHPVSTFSADVDTASYSNVRRMILQDSYVDAGAVRLEEMINYFSYDYEKPNGEHPFAVTTELANCPWNDETKLLLVSIQTDEVDFSESLSSNLVFLIDVSGSMFEDNKLPLVQKAFTMLAENLTKKDKVSIVVYAGEEAVLLEGASGADYNRIAEAINQLSAGGSTAGSKGIQTAYEIAQDNFIAGGNNRVILATDGDLNVGITSESELTDLISEKRDTGIYLSVLGFGTGNYKDNKMEALADQGNGNYAYIDTLLEAKKVLVEEMGATLLTVAKDVKIQVEFNPATVKGYRLVGYENRLLATEDFEDDTKDAGEVGAGHSVTALYEIVLPDSELDIPSTDLIYQEQPKNSESSDLLTINIRYKKPEESTSILMKEAVNKGELRRELPSNLKFAAAVAEFGMLLRDSEFKGSSTFEGIISMLADEDFSEDAYRQEFIELVKAAEELMTVIEW